MRTEENKYYLNCIFLPAENPPFDRWFEPHIMKKQDRTKSIT